MPEKRYANGRGSDDVDVGFVAFVVIVQKAIHTPTNQHLTSVLVLSKKARIHREGISSSFPTGD